MGQAREAELTSRQLVRFVRQAALRWILLGVAIATPSVALWAQTSPTQSDSDRVRAIGDLFFRAVADERWKDAAAFIDSVSMRRIVTAYAMQRRTQTASDVVSAEFAGLKSPREVATLDLLDATALYVQARDERVVLREQTRRAGCPVQTGPLTNYRVRHILGVVIASESLAYLLHTADAAAEYGDLSAYPAPAIMQLVRRQGRWQITPRSDLLSSNGTLPVVQCDSTRRSPS